MTKVILLTFGVLGWAWYELSGGADFQPGQNGVTLLASAPKVKIVEPVEPQVARADTTAAPLTSFGTAKLDNVFHASTAVTPAQTFTPTFAPAITPAVAKVASLDSPAVISDAVIDVAAVQVDYRQVTGSRVNLRGGPGTNFDVVTQLLRGEEVEVIDSMENGWVKLRALDGGNIGWMSDGFLKAVN
ncbi:MAG: SH3 domain-containing protein [Pelagimonas sp.]|uniref:SH3 domain-containing protein n=1 Tax=Pelagimonas sp. TaxID=2073170 RepID=UPI003D6AA934